MAYSSIVKPTDYFNTVLWTGNATDGRAITGVGFQPDWVWIKNRDTASNHSEYDVIRTATKRLRPNLTNAEDTKSNGLQSFDSDGFTVGDSTVENNSGDGIVAWNWLAANGTASNGDGSITSTVSVNTTAGFSIVSYTGTGSAATVGHGLGAVPKLIITKGRSFSDDWLTYHEGIGNGKYIILNKTDGEASSSLPWNSTTPTSSVFSIGSSGTTNNNGGTIIAYCFAEVKGFSKFGTYQGVNDTGTAGSINDVFVYTGFKPAFLLLKKYNSSGTGWFIFDNKRDDDNPISSFLMPQATNSEDSSLTRAFDLLSNGFKSRGNSDDTSGAGSSYLYAAFAENPFVGNDSGTAVPVTAR